MVLPFYERQEGPRITLFGVALYWIECANLANPHSHVLSVKVKKWRDDGTKGGTWDDGGTLQKATVVIMIDNGDEFRTIKKGGGDVKVIHEPCSSACPEEALRTQSDDLITDNLDHIPCS
jgi:hypothetical protein